MGLNEGLKELIVWKPLWLIWLWKSISCIDWLAIPRLKLPTTGGVTLWPVTIPVLGSGGWLTNVGTELCKSKAGSCTLGVCESRVSGQHTNFGNPLQKAFGWFQTLDFFLTAACLLLFCLMYKELSSVQWQIVTVVHFLLSQFIQILSGGCLETCLWHLYNNWRNFLLKK